MTDLPLDSEISRIVDSIYRKKYFSKKINVSSDLEALFEISIKERQPLKLFYLWGTHRKDRMNNADKVALSFLTGVIKHIENVMSETSCTIDFTLVISDIHGKINEVPDANICSYVAEVSEWAVSNNGWKIRYLSEIWKKHGLSVNKILEFAESVPDEAIDGLLIKFAGKYYGGRDKKAGAKRYLVARQLEKAIIEKEFCGCIHVSAADTRLIYLQPDLPHFQVWGIKRGTSKKPWFMNGFE